MADEITTPDPTKAAPAAVAAPPIAPKLPPQEPPEQPITLNEFVLGYAQEAEVETMGAFRAVERAAGRLADKASAYLARLRAFMNEQH